MHQTQAKLLRELLNKNSDCRFGRQFGFDGIRDVDRFRQRVPLADYLDFETHVEAICAGQQNVLTSERVRLLEPTSGTSSGRRLIPYTAALQHQFQRGISAWIADLFRQRPDVRRGRAYWSVTPAIERETTPGGLAIGFADDTEYLGPIARRVAKKLLAVPASEMHNVRQEDVLLETVRRLIQIRDLSLISVWSPTFLSSMVRLLEEKPEGILCSLENSNSVVQILKSSISLPEKLIAIWPQLAMISCWADGSAANYVPALQVLFPNVEIQPKGLVSTEAFISFPLVDHSGSALAIRSHFFEFQPDDDPSSETKLAHELIEGQRYKVVVTTGGGLYRYQTHDVITVVGFLDEAPLIRFCGRTNQTSDLVGEKLTPVFVEDSLSAALQELGLENVGALLIPVAAKPGYQLFVECANSSSVICAAVESHLHTNPYYKHAVKTGQLMPLVAIGIRHAGRLVQAYEDHLASFGLRRGDIKPTVLVSSQHADGVLKRLLQHGTQQ